MIDARAAGRAALAEWLAAQPTDWYADDEDLSADEPLVVTAIRPRTVETRTLAPIEYVAKNG